MVFQLAIQKTCKAIVDEVSLMSMVNPKLFWPNFSEFHPPNLSQIVKTFHSTKKEIDQYLFFGIISVYRDQFS